MTLHLLGKAGGWLPVRRSATVDRVIRRLRRTDRKLSSANMVAVMGSRTNKEESPPVAFGGQFLDKIRGDRTPVELFVQGIRAWEHRIRVLLTRETVKGE